MKRNLLLGVSGSVAAVTLPKLYNALLPFFNVKIVLTNEALNFISEEFLFKTDFHVNEDEMDYFTKQKKVLHIDLINWASIFLIAPLSANTLAKMGYGLCDNLLTNCVRAWDRNKIMILAPAMNTRMWENGPTYPALGKVIEYYRARIIDPVVKTLVCGDTGKGAMADIGDIVDAARKESRWKFPIGRNIRGVPVNNHPGSFGYKRSYYYHPGVDLYTEGEDPVYAVEDGIIIKSGDFTGKSQGHFNKDGEAYWEDTKYLAVRGASGVVVYGEIEPENTFLFRKWVSRGSYLGRVKRVLPKGKERPDIEGHSPYMLHLELYSELKGEPVSWHHEEERNLMLLDPTDYLLDANGNEIIKELTNERN